MNFKRILHFSFLFVITGSLPAQQSIVDSLKQLLPEAIEDTNKVFLLGDIAFYLYNLNPEESFEYGNQTLELAKKIGFERGVINGYYKMCIAKYGQSDFQGAEKYALLALEQAEKMDYGSRKSPIYNILGIISKHIGDYEKAIYWGFESEKIAREYGMEVDVGVALSNIGTLYLELADTLNAKKYLLDAILIFKANEEKLHLVETYSNLVKLENDTATKRALLETALMLAQEENYISGLAYNYFSLGNFYSENQEDYDLAKKNFIKALYYIEQVGDQFQKAVICVDFGNMLFLNNQLDSSQILLEQGLALANKLNLKLQIVEAKKTLSQIYAKKGNYGLAYELLKASFETNDSLYNENIAEELAIANSRFESEKKETLIAQQELQLEREKNLRNRGFFGAFLLILVGSIIFQWNFNRQKNKKKEAQLAYELEHVKSENLEKLDHLKSEFFTNISHELRTPLTLISAPLQEALQKSNNLLVKEELELAHRNSKKLLNLVNEILDLARLQDGKLGLTESKVNLYKVVRRIFYSYHSFAQIQNIDMILDYEADEDAFVVLDVGKFEKILNNLISNAIKFSENEGTVKLAVNSESDVFNFSVIDNGKGIEPDEIDRVFDRFYQSQKSTPSIQGGIGVGLALSKELSKLLEGELTVVSKINEGSTFTLSLPIKVIDNPIPEKPIQNEYKQDIDDLQKERYEQVLIQGNKPRILITEDNHDMQKFLKKILSPYFNCKLAGDGFEALKYIQTETFDLIISDVMMPKMDGFTLKEKVNSLPAYKLLPFIMLTARISDDDKLTGLQLGVDDYITKPFSTKELIARIHNLLVNKRERERWMSEHLGVELFEEPVQDSDVKILKEAEGAIIKNISNPDFKVGDLARSIGFGERQLRRTIKSLTGLSPVELILEIRLQKAYKMLENHAYLTVSEVRYEVGIESSSYFTSKFKQRFGMNPKDLLN